MLPVIGQITGMSTPRLAKHAQLTLIMTKKRELVVNVLQICPSGMGQHVLVAHQANTTIKEANDAYLAQWA